MKKKMLNRIFALAFSTALSLSMTVPVMADALETPQAEAVAEGLIDEVGGIQQALDKLRSMIKIRSSLD